MQKKKVYINTIQDDLDESNNSFRFLISNLSDSQQQNICSLISNDLRNNESFLTVCSKVKRIKSHFLDHYSFQDQEIKPTFSAALNPEILNKMKDLMKYFNSNSNNEHISPSDRRELLELANALESYIHTCEESAFAINSDNSMMSKELLYKARKSCELLFEYTQKNPENYPATSEAIKVFGENKLYEIIDKHVKFYGDWENYTLKINQLTQHYGSQQLYGCLMAAFSYALAEEINDTKRASSNTGTLDDNFQSSTDETFYEKRQSFSEIIDNEENFQDEVSDLHLSDIEESNNNRYTKAEVLITLACFGRQLIAHMQNPNSDRQRGYGALRFRDLKKCASAFTPLDGPYADLNIQLANKFESFPTDHQKNLAYLKKQERVYLNKTKDMSPPFFHSLYQDTFFFSPIPFQYQILPEAIPSQSLPSFDTSSEWIKKDEDGTISYLAIDGNGKKMFTLSVFNPSQKILHHTALRGGEDFVYKDILNDCLSIEGEKIDPKILYQRLGEFFWWWCQVKPVDLGDPSIGEIIYKSILISKGLPVYGWKEGILPWGETLLHCEPREFGKYFSSMWTGA